jgi:predicted nuclease with TOPRIM domain
MHLMRQLLDDYRELERELARLAAENQGLRRELERLEKAVRVELTGQIDTLRAERDRLDRESRRLEEEVRLWRTRHDDLARE